MDRHRLDGRRRATADPRPGRVGAGRRRHRRRDGRRTTALVRGARSTTSRRPTRSGPSRASATGCSTNWARWAIRCAGPGDRSTPGWGTATPSSSSPAARRLPGARSPPPPIHAAQGCRLFGRGRAAGAVGGRRSAAARAAGGAVGGRRGRRAAGGAGGGRRGRRAARSAGGRRRDRAGVALRSESPREAPSHTRTLPVACCAHDRPPPAIPSARPLPDPPWRDRCPRTSARATRTPASPSPNAPPSWHGSSPRTRTSARRSRLRPRRRTRKTSATGSGSAQPQLQRLPTRSRVRHRSARGLRGLRRDLRQDVPAVGHHDRRPAPDRAVGRRPLSRRTPGATITEALGISLSAAAFGPYGLPHATPDSGRRGTRGERARPGRRITVRGKWPCRAGSAVGGERSSF